jgi:hypothetical protein
MSFVIGGWESPMAILSCNGEEKNLACTANGTLTVQTLAIRLSDRTIMLTNSLPYRLQ